MRCSPSPPSSGGRDLKGKTISIGGPKDITRIYLERMAGPNGVKPGDYDTVFAGATSARFSALQGGAVDAAILLPPFNFYAESAGFTNLGLTIDYAKELPFAGAVVGRAWASYAQGHARQGALGPQQEHGLVLRSAEPRRSDQDHGGREQAQGGRRREAPTTSCTRTSSSRPPARSRRTKMGALLKALKDLGDIEGSIDVERFVLPGVTQLTD